MNKRMSADPVLVNARKQLDLVTGQLNKARSEKRAAQDNENKIKKKYEELLAEHKRSSKEFNRRSVDLSIREEAVTSVRDKIDAQDKKLRNRLRKKTQELSAAHAKARNLESIIKANKLPKSFEVTALVQKLEETQVSNKLLQENYRVLCGEVLTASAIRKTGHEEVLNLLTNAAFDFAPSKSADTQEENFNKQIVDLADKIEATVLEALAEQVAPKLGKIEDFVEGTFDDLPASLQNYVDHLLDWCGGRGISPKAVPARAIELFFTTYVEDYVGKSVLLVAEDSKLLGPGFFDLSSELGPE